MIKNSNEDWVNLVDQYREWKDMVAKGRLRMKKKTDKKGKQYYDFDFSRYQYYYSFPEDHISMAPPIAQRQFIEKALEEHSSDFTAPFIEENEGWETFEKILKPYEYHTLLEQMHKEFEERITRLRIQKSLRIVEMKNIIVGENEYGKALIQLIDAEIRSYCHKLIKIDDIFYKFGKSTEKRLESLQSNLKTRKIDQLQIGNVDKTQLIIYLRSRQSTHSLQYNIKILSKIVTNLYHSSKQLLLAEAKIKKSRFIKAKKSEIQKWKIFALTKIQEEMGKADPVHFQLAENKQKLDEVIESLDYISAYQKNIQKSCNLKYLKPESTALCLLNYNQFAYRPMYRSEVIERLRSKCRFYFDEYVLDEEIFKSSDEHLCYKINSLCFLQLKTLWETYDPSIKYEDGNLLKIRHLMKMELNLVFSRTIDKMFNIRQHSLKLTVFQKWNPNILYKYVPKYQKQSIMMQQLKKEKRFQDPFIISTIALLDMKKDTAVRQHLQKYVNSLIENASNTFYHKKLFYDNCCSDEKKHLLNVLNHCASLKAPEQDPRTFIYLKALYKCDEEQFLKENILYSYYSLVFLMCSQNKYRLLQILNAQRACMTKIQNRLQLLWKKGKIPFNMSKQFLNRFVDNAINGSNPFQFTSSEKCDQHLEGLFKNLEADETQRDTIVRKNDMVEVQRRKSQNVLMQGKPIIYQDSYTDLEQTLNRLEMLCSRTIKFREQYLPDGKFTYLVDRFELLFDFIDHQRKFQQKKLDVLETYCQMFLQSISPTAIHKIYKQMHDIKHYDCFIDITQSNYITLYQQEIQIMSHRALILQNLVKKQRIFEQQYIANSFGNMKRANLSNKVPELSSMYFVEEISADHENQVIEEASQQNMSQSRVSQNQSDSPHQHITIGSEISSLLQGGSQYHLKVSFQQILTKNSIPQISSDNAKKEELMNKKKQNIISDSVLGNLIEKKISKFEGLGHKGQNYITYFQSSQYVLNFMHVIDGLLRQNYKDSLFCALLLQKISDEIRLYVYDEYKPIITPDQLVLGLNGSHRAIQKFYERAKNQTIQSGRLNSDHLLCIPSEIMTRVVTNETHSEIDEMRGLYVALNIIHLTEIDYVYQIEKQVQSNKFGPFNVLTSCLEQYCGGGSELIDSLSLGKNKLQKKIFTHSKLMQSLDQNTENYYLGVGNYFHYFRAAMTVDLALRSITEKFAHFVWNSVSPTIQLINQLMIVEEFQCCTELFQRLYKVTNITNRVFLRKKIDFLKSYQRSIIKKQLIQELNSTVKSILEQIKEPAIGVGGKSSSVHNLIPTCQTWESFINRVANAGISFIELSQQIHGYVRNSEEIFIIKQFTRVLPHISKALCIQTIPNRLLSVVFIQNSSLFQQNQHLEKHDKMVISCEKLNLSKILQNISDNSEHRKEWIQQHFKNRNKKELTYDPKQIEYFRFENRHCTKIIRHNSLTLKNTLKLNHEFSNKMEKSKKLRVWLQTEIIVYGSTLSEEELFKMRKILMNPFSSFPVFWINNIENLITSKDLSKMRSDKFDQSQLIENYKNSYLQFANLRKRYAHFLDDLSEFTFSEELSDSLYVLYFACKKYFIEDEQDWNFIFKYASADHKISPNPVDQMLTFMYHKNPARLRTPQFLQWRTQPNSSQTYHFDINKVQFYAWNSKTDLSVIDEGRRYIKYRLNDFKSYSAKSITNEIAFCYYRKQRIKELMDFLGISSSDYPIEGEDYMNNFDKYAQEGQATMNNSERFIYQLSERDNQSKREFVKVKDQIMQMIIANQFSLKIIRSHFYKLSTDIINRELTLRNLLQENYKIQQSIPDQLIMKQTLNKILIPKVKMNPFLSSPLRFENYFFAGSAKLSFIDLFLNKLRNRAVLIELAEGGTGYLLKVSELDESVEILCKGLVGFSQKQFSDRLRTIYESFDEVLELVAKERAQKQKLKTIIKSYQIQQTKQVKSIVYSKLTEYLVRFHEHEKNFNVIINLLKSLENKCRKQIGEEYEKQIQGLKFQIASLQTGFKNFVDSYRSNTKTHLLESKDLLYDDFKHKAEVILNKNFIDDLPSEDRYTEIEHHDSTILLQRLKKQKVFYEMRINKLQAFNKEKIQNLQKKLLEQNKLQNLLNIEQEKVKHLTEEIKSLQKCSVENQMLRKEILKKDEEESMNRFRLVKVNESLRGKLKRIDQEHERENGKLLEKIEEMQHQQEKSKTSFSVQVGDKVGIKNMKRKSFYAKTEVSEDKGKEKVIQHNLWKERWMKTSKIHHGMVEKLKKITEHLHFTRNSAKAYESLKQLLNSTKHN